MIDKSTNEHIAILAYGSLIWEPGEDIEQHTIAVVDCITPFNIEYAQRSHKTRCGAPTLTKVEGFGGKTRAKLFIIDYHNNEEGKKKVYSIVCKREGVPEKVWSGKDKPPTPIFITSVDSYNTVFYCAFKGEEKENVIIQNLIKWAKDSVINCNKECKLEKNGIRYLINCYKSGVITPLSEEYIQAIGGTNIEQIEKRILNEVKNVR